MSALGANGLPACHRRRDLLAAPSYKHRRLCTSSGPKMAVALTISPSCTPPPNCRRLPLQYYSRRVATTILTAAADICCATYADACPSSATSPSQRPPVAAAPPGTNARFGRRRLSGMLHTIKSGAGCRLQQDSEDATGVRTLLHYERN